MPVPLHLHALLDDTTAVHFGATGLDRAVQAHRGHRDAWYGDLVGPLVVSDAMLPRLAQTSPPGTGALEVVVAVSGGAGAVEPAVLWATRTPGLHLSGLRVTMRESDAGDLAPNARRIVAAVDDLLASGTLDEEVAVYVEPPPLAGPQPTPSWLSALDELATVDHGLTLRPDGQEGGGPGPTSGRLAVCIDAALDRELRFRCSGLGGAVRHQDPHTGADRHGFLNVLLATRASLDGAGRAEVAAVLEETDASALAADDAALASAHRWFVSCDTDSVPESVHDLVDLGRLQQH